MVFMATHNVILMNDGVPTCTFKNAYISAATHPRIDHICINSLVPSVQKINIGNTGNQVNYWGGGLNHLINFADYLDFQYWFLFSWEPAN